MLHSPLIFLFNKILAFLNIKRLLNDAFGNVETFFFFGRFVTLFLHMIPWYCFTKVIPSITLRSSKDMGPCKKIGTQFISMMVTATTLTTPHTHTHTHTHKFDWSSENKNTCCTCATHLRTIPPCRPLQNKNVKLPYDNFSTPL